MTKDKINACNCDKCACANQDDYTEENGTCEDCFRDCQPIECDCTEVCGWTKPHYVTEGSCPNCGTNVSLGEESMIEFDCETHGEISWYR
jgi:hypothetical protein